ncbi:hypothetical protein CRYUN_Cryun16bG0088600 [Craigia yunnanensis]
MSPESSLECPVFASLLPPLVRKTMMLERRVEEDWSVGEEDKAWSFGEEEKDNGVFNLKVPNRAFGDLIAASGITDAMLDSWIALKDLEGVDGLPPLSVIEDMRYEKNTRKSTRAEISWRNLPKQG